MRERAALLDDDGLLDRVDRSLARAAHAEDAAEDFRSDIGQIGGVTGHAKTVVQFDQRIATTVASAMSCPSALPSDNHDLSADSSEALELDDIRLIQYLTTVIPAKAGIDSR